MRTSRWLMAAGVLALCGNAATAQPPGGFGGFGGGGFGGGGVANLRVALFSNKALQEELKITDEQAGKLKEAGAKQAEALKPFIPPAPVGFGGPGGGGGMRFPQTAQAPRDDDGALAFYKLQVQLIEERAKVIQATLSADQQKRLTQLENQQLGVAAFTNARVVKALGLSDEATKKFAEMTDGMNKESQEMTQAAFQDGFDREKMQELQKRQRVLREETVEKMEKALTADQRTKWKEMTGEAFDFTKLVPMRKDQ